MSLSAFTWRKYLVTLRTSSRGVPRFISASMPRARGAAPDPRVHSDSEEQDHAEEGEVPVGIPVGEDDPNLGKADDQCPDRRADRRSVASGQEAAAHHC